MTTPTYFWSGSNLPGEIDALAKHGQAVGVSVPDLDGAGRAMAALEGLAPRRPVVANVARNGSGKPILMLCRQRDQLPTGDTAVRVGGRSMLFGFRKIAVNVARSVADGANELASTLREMFGDDAGARGKGHKVALVMTREGWEMSEHRLGELAARGTRVFVDSGAFGEVKFCPEAGRLVDRNPITHAEWTRRLDAYQRIAKALGSNAFLVAPDKVGDQAETLRRLALYAPRVRALRALGANIIVPIQRGEMAGADFDRECARVLGFDDYIRGIPSKKAAASVAEIAELSSSLPVDARIHLLGLGPFGSRYRAVLAAIGRQPELVFCDSVRIKALVGRTNGPGGGPRILTKLADQARVLLGIPARRRYSTDESYAIKFASLDAYFSHHFSGI
jgi:hypothetical protein